MDLSKFVEQVLVELNSAVDSARAKTSRDIHFTDTDSSRTVEFDIAVSAEDKSEASGKAGVRVLKFVEGGGNISKGTVNTTVSRVKFGINISHMTKTEQAESVGAVIDHNRNLHWQEY